MVYFSFQFFEICHFRFSNIAFYAFSMSKNWIIAVATYDKYCPWIFNILTNNFQHTNDFKNIIFRKFEYWPLKLFAPKAIHISKSCFYDFLLKNKAHYLFLMIFYSYFASQIHKERARFCLLGWSSTLPYSLLSGQNGKMVYKILSAIFLTF